MSKPADFNDLRTATGLEEVSRQVAAARPAAPLANWPEPVLPGGPQVPELPAELLPGCYGTMAAAVADSTQTPPALAVMTCVSVLAVALQGRYEVAPFDDDYIEPLAIWTLTALGSGNRKTSVFNSLTAPAVRWEKLMRDRARSDIAKANSARGVSKKRIERLLADSAKAKDDEERERIREEIQREEEAMPEEVRPPRLFTSDITSERLQGLLVEHGGRMAVLSEEGGQLTNMAGLYSGGVSNNDVFLQGHAGTPMRVDRAGRAAHIDKPALSFGLALQPGVLAEVAGNRRFRDSGLLARFLYALPVSNVGKRDVRRRVPVPPKVREAYEAALFELLEGAEAKPSTPTVLGCSAAAREQWLDLAEEIEREQGPGGRYESMCDWTSKLPGAVARLAALLELAQTGLQAAEVSPASMERATRLGRLLIPHAQAAFSLLGADQVEADALAVLKWVQAHQMQEFSRRECQKAMEGRFRKVERLNKALALLTRQHVLRSFTRTNKGAPPTSAYVVNPKALSALSGMSQ